MALLFPMIDDQQHRSVLLVLRGAAHSEKPLGEGQDPFGWSLIHLELARNTPLPPSLPTSLSHPRAVKMVLSVAEHLAQFTGEGQPGSHLTKHWGLSDTSGSGPGCTRGRQES